jgi:Ran-binding protein 1
LYVFGETIANAGTGEKTWNEKGMGNVRFLQHKKKKTIRLLMRDATLKVIMNHGVDTRIVMEPNKSAPDRSWVWSAFDFSDGEVLKETMFTIRFKEPSTAAEFKAKFEQCQEEMKALLASRKNDMGGDKEEAADEATESLSKLTLNGDGDKNRR